MHALGELGLRDAELLHATENAAQERRADMVKCIQGDAGERGTGNGDI